MGSKFICLALLCLGSSSLYAQIAPEQLPADAAAVGVIPPVTPAPPPPTLSQDLNEIVRLIQFKPLNQLLVRYLINDAQFQAFVRIINSREGFTARWRLNAQPEFVQFHQWVSQQLLASRKKFKLEENEIVVSLFNPYPYWSSTVFGWQGFFNELQMYLPTHAIRAHIQAKLLQQGSLAQFWTRLAQLQPVYERWLALPETQAVINQLQTEGVDTTLLDQFIREQLGWTAGNATSTVTFNAALPPVEAIII